VAGESILLGGIKEIGTVLELSSSLLPFVNCLNGERSEHDISVV